MDAESWYSATPEPIARQIAEHFQTAAVNGKIIDGFCGSGFNAIQFAKICDEGNAHNVLHIAYAKLLVIAIDIDPVKLHCARRNAQIYGVDNITFLNMDFLKIDPLNFQLGEFDGIFMSPPWGGSSYQIRIERLPDN